MRMRRSLGWVVPALAVLVGCGGVGNGSSGGIVPPNGTNVAAVVVDAGPKGANGSPVGYVNGIFTTVTVCVPGTSTCQNIDHVLVDTGSSGLRLLANDGTAGGQLTVALRQQRDTPRKAIPGFTRSFAGVTPGPTAPAARQLS